MISGSSIFRSVVACFSLVAVSLTCGFVHAESVTVNVRTLSASGSVGNSGAIVLDSKIEDLRSQLQDLHFGTYQLVSSRSEVIPAKKKQVMLLDNGQKLIIRPISSEKDRVCLWLHWQDASGIKLLDTRMHLESGKSMLAGTDSTDNNGMILAINVRER